MLRAFLVVALLAVAAWSGVAVAAPAADEDASYPRDLKADHWAYDVARRLAQRGILKGFPDRTFRGNAPVNRYQLAIAIDQALQQLETRLDRVEAAPPARKAGDAHAAGDPADDEFEGLRPRHLTPPNAERIQPVRAATLVDDTDNDRVASDASGEILGAAPVQPSLAPGDAEALARLTREFSRELSTLRLRTATIEERSKKQRKDLDALGNRVGELETRVKHDESFRFVSGELRLVGNYPEDLRSFSNLILDYDFRVSDRISGVFAPQLTLAFDGHLDDKLDVWEAYADFADYGFVNNARIGRQLMTVGAGLTLFDRVEAFNFSGTYADTFFQVLLLGDTMVLAETRAFTNQALGFYFMEENKNALGERPLHFGAYLKGNVDRTLYVGVEYANTANRVETAQNPNTYTNGYLADVIWTPSSSFRMRESVIVEEEDFRALSIDRDLAYHSPVSSPLEDALQALSQSTREFPFPTARNELNGFWDLKSGIEVDLPHSRYRLGLDWDHVRQYSVEFDNSLNGFDVYGVRLKRPMANGAWLEVRLRELSFQHPDPFVQLGTLDVPRIDRTDVRVQWFGKF